MQFDADRHSGWWRQHGCRDWEWQRSRQARQHIAEAKTPIKSNSISIAARNSAQSQPKSALK